MPGSGGIRWELMPAHITRRCHCDPAPPAPPKEPPRPHPGWGKSPLQVGQALAVPRQRDRDPEQPAGVPQGRQRFCCGSSSTLGFIPFSDTAFPETPETLAPPPALP